MPKMPNARDIAIFQARTNGQTPAELSQHYHVSQERIRQIVRKTGMLLLRHEMLSLRNTDTTDNDILQLYRTNYKIINFPEEHILHLWHNINGTATRQTLQKEPADLNFHRVVLQNLFHTNSDECTIQFLSHSVYVQIQSSDIVLIGQAELHDNHIQVSIIHPANGLVSSESIRFADYIECRPTGMNDPAYIVPYISFDNSQPNERPQWIPIAPNQKELNALADTVLDYFKLFGLLL